MANFVLKRNLFGVPLAGIIGFFVLVSSSIAYAATITVTGTGDTIAVDGVVTLREAITSANNNASINADVSNQNPGAYGADFINFNITGSGVKTINLTSALPIITGPVIMNGYSQPGSSVNTQANTVNALVLIQLNGTNAGAGANGLTLGSGSTNSIIKGLVINRFSGNGILIQSNLNSITGNFIGVDPAGLNRLPNGTFPNTGDGILIQNSSNNIIGTVRRVIATLFPGTHSVAFTSSAPSRPRPRETKSKATLSAWTRAGSKVWELGPSRRRPQEARRATTCTASRFPAAQVIPSAAQRPAPAMSSGSTPRASTSTTAPRATSSKAITLEWAPMA